MFTVETIRRTIFEKSVRGYRVEDVDDFISSVADDFEKLLKEKQALEEQNIILAEKNEQYAQEEESIKSAILNANRLGESIIAEARQKAEGVLREANIKKNDILAGAHEERDSNEHELTRLKKEVSDFKINILSMYRKHIELLSGLPEVNEEVEEIETVQEEDFNDASTKEIEFDNTKFTNTITEEKEDTINSLNFEKDFVVNEDKFKNIASLFDE